MTMIRTKLISIALAFGTFSGAPAFAHEEGIEVFRTVGRDTPPANIAVSEDGRIFMSTHQAYGSPDKVVELLPDGTYRRYPDAEFFPELTGVLGAIVDREGILWLLNTTWDNPFGQVIGWDIDKDELYKIFYIARPIFGDAYILNDLAVDRDRNMLYITDTGGDTNSALLVLDIETGLVRRVLEGSFATVPEDRPLIVDGAPVKMQGKDARVGVNPITIDVANEWVYFAPMSSGSIYRARAEDLANPDLSAKELESRVETYAAKPMGDGITIDAAGNLYVSDLENNAIGMIGPDRKYRILHQDDELLNWVEGFANAGPDGIYATVNQLHKSAAFNDAEEKPETFRILRFQPKGFASFGR